MFIHFQWSASKLTVGVATQATFSVSHPQGSVQTIGSQPITITLTDPAEDQQEKAMSAIPDLYFCKHVCNTYTCSNVKYDKHTNVYSMYTASA